MSYSTFVVPFGPHCGSDSSAGGHFGLALHSGFLSVAGPTQFGPRLRRNSERLSISSGSLDAIRAAPSWTAYSVSIWFATSSIAVTNALSDADSDARSLSTSVA